MNSKEQGILYIVSTPIGNLGDITYRAVEILRDVSLIAAEDTRHTSILTKRYEIDTPRLSFFDHNAKGRLPGLIARLKKGDDIALVSDAGTPGISDPGYLLIKESIAEGIRVETAPGASAVITALVLSGLPTDKFVFEGFLPVKKGRKTRLELLAEEKRTIVLYESPHRILRTLKDIQEKFGDREIAVAREMTKMHEEVIRAKVSGVREIFEEKKPRGEFVLVIAGKE